MTVASEVNRAGPYNGNGVTVVFAYGFRILDAGHLQVIKADADGNETTLILTTDYTVSGVGNAGGGSISLGVAPATGTTITILRNMPFTQETDLENQGAYYAETVEDAIDAAAMRDQQLQEQLDRAVLVPASEGSAGGELAAQLARDITRLAQSADEIDTVAGVQGDVVTVANMAEDIALLADLSPVLSGTASAGRMDESIFVGDGVQTAFTLARAPGVDENVLVWVGGAIQDTTDYTVTDVTLTLNVAPPNLAKVRTLIMSLVTANVIEALRDEAIAARDQALTVASALPPILANRMLVDNASGTARETKTFAQVVALLNALPKTGGSMTGSIVFDNGSDPVIPTVPVNGTYEVNISGTSHFRIWCDLDGDGDYDADMWSKDNMYLVAESSIHLRPGYVVGQPEQGRIVLRASNSINYIQSARNYAGTTHNSLAISKYNSSFAWALFDEPSGGFMGLGMSYGTVPAARLHALDGGATVGVIQSSGSATARIGFRGTGTAGNTTVTIGAFNDNLRMRAGGVDVLDVKSASVDPITDVNTSLGSSILRYLKGWFGNVSLFPAASVTPTVNGEVTFQLTSNTQLTFKVKGSDGTVRSASVTLS